MKIENTTSLKQLERNASGSASTKKVDTASQSSSHKSSVEVSDSLYKILQDSDQLSTFDLNKVESIKSAIKQGNFKINSSVVAENLLLASSNFLSIDRKTS